MMVNDQPALSVLDPLDAKEDNMMPSVSTALEIVRAVRMTILLLDRAEIYNSDGRMMAE